MAGNSPAQSTLITTLETHSFRAWSALEEIEYDGWVLRFADGYTRRANSINPVYSSARDINQKIAHCESVYRQRGLRVVFKMTDAVYPHNLDVILDSQGYHCEAETAVYHQPDITALETSMSSFASYTDVLTDDWLDDFVRLNVMDTRHLTTMRQMLNKTEAKMCYMSLNYGQAVVAVGIGVSDGDYLSFYDIVTDTSHRQQGFGTALIQSLFHWGKSQEATKAFLQVVTDNIPALNLYRKFGFNEVYRYWYRVKDV